MVSSFMLFKLLSSILIFGSLIMFFSSSPYFGVFGVLVQALMFSILLSLFGSPFFGLLILLIYVGGLLVVFLFSTVLSAEEFPRLLFSEIFLFWFGFKMIFYSFLCKVGSLFTVSFLNMKSVGGENQFGELYGEFFWLVIYVALFLLITLVAVLRMNFECGESSLRSV